MQSKNSSENRRTRFVNVGQDNTDELVLVAKALGSPMRIQILEFLQDKTANVSEIAQGIGIPRATADPTSLSSPTQAFLNSKRFRRSEESRKSALAVTTSLCSTCLKLRRVSCSMS